MGQGVAYPLAAGFACPSRDIPVSYFQKGNLMGLFYFFRFGSLF